LSYLLEKGMGGIVSGITNAIGLTDTEDAGDQSRIAAGESAAAQREGSQIAADAMLEGTRLSIAAQREALEYMKQREALPQRIREGALTGLEGYFQVPDAPMGQQAMIAQAQQSPLYSAIMGGQQAGEEAILRNASATGGLRSGNVQENLARYSGDLQNQALLTSFNQAQGREDFNQQTNLGGLQSLANIQSNAPMIANQMSGIGATQGAGAVGVGQTLGAGATAYGNTLAQGRIAQTQANIGAQNQLFGDVTGLVGMGIDAMNPAAKI
jgi:hypothetical protein